jgi:hypothetical protein
VLIRMRELAELYPRCGYRRIQVFLARDRMLMSAGRVGGFERTELSGLTGPWGGARAADLDGDGHQDLLLIGDTGVLPALGDGTGAFTPLADTALERPGLSPHSAALLDLDLDRDGDLDVYLGVHSPDLTLFAHGHPDVDGLPADTCSGNRLPPGGAAFTVLRGLQQSARGPPGGRFDAA